MGRAGSCCARRGSVCACRVVRAEVLVIVLRVDEWLVRVRLPCGVLEGLFCGLSVDLHVMLPCVCMGVAAAGQ